MGYRTLQQCIDDLDRNGQLIRVTDEVDPRLEMAEIQRRVYCNGGPAVLFENVKNCSFPMVSNLFGTIERARFMFRDTIENVRRAIELKIEPNRAIQKPLRYIRAPLTAMAMRPKRVRRAAVTQHSTTISQLPHLISWPLDAGGFVTLPQVYSEDATKPGLNKSNLGMYRIQLTGNQYALDQQIGLHYQTHRSIGVHHKAAIEAGKPFRVNIFIGGTPSMTLSAVMPLPEGMSELTFAGALAGHRIRMKPIENGSHIYADADFCICGTVFPDQLLPEGPFGDHLGYYSLAHDFPVLQVEKVYHRKNAIWPFTVVGRPPQEDTVFGELIHELTGPIIPTVLPGVKAVHAVDAAGVHPLLLAIGSERYTPYNEPDRPQEILTQANAILGQGQLSLAKYLWIIDQGCVPDLDIHNIEMFLINFLQRVDWQRDLHFQTQTTIDTLDYSGSGFNQGSKLILAAAGSKKRNLSNELESISSIDWPTGFKNPQVALAGVLAIEGPKYSQNSTSEDVEKFCRAFQNNAAIDGFPLIVVVDDSEFCVKSLNNFLWMVFTRSDPAQDVHGIDSGVRQKHWGCRGSLVIDARIKPHHAPPLVEDPEITKRVDARAARNDALAKYL